MTEKSKKLKIDIMITRDGEEVIKGSAYGFEAAEEELGKLERFCKNHTFCGKCGDIVRSEIGFEEGDTLCGRCAY